MSKIASEIYRGYDLMWFPETGRVEISKDSIVEGHATGINAAKLLIDGIRREQLKARTK